MTNKKVNPPRKDGARISNRVNKVVSDIKSIKIQGATNIAKASIGAFSNYSKGFSGGKSAVFLKEIEKIAKALALARPDEPLNQNLLNFITAKLESDKSGDFGERIANFQKSCQEALGLIAKNEESITVNGINLIKEIYKRKRKPVLVFTHCNSSSVARILIGAHRAKTPFKVYNSETRPRFQGRILAKHLAKNGIGVTIMTDSAAPFVISKNDPDKIDITLVIIGADVISMDGSVLNKIGSYSLALAAKNAGVPFYVASSLLKVRKDIDSYKKIEIEKRDPTELWSVFASVFAKTSADKKTMAGKQKFLKRMKVINYAFDTVPPEYITGFISEFGVIKSKDVKKVAMKKYKEIFKSND